MIVYLNAHIENCLKGERLKHTKKMHLYVHKADLRK